MEELEAIVAFNHQQAKVEGMMSGALSLSGMAADRYAEKMCIAAEVLMEHHEAALSLIDSAFETA